MLLFSRSVMWLCDPVHCSTPSFLVVHHLLEPAQTHVHWVGDTIESSHPVVPFSSYLQSFPASGSFPVSQLFASGGQSIGASTWASVLPMNIQGWFLLGLTGLISLQSKGFSRVFSNTTLKSINSLALRLHIHTWLLENSFAQMDLRWQSDVSAF